MTDGQRITADNGAGAPALRDQLLRDALGDCLPLVHIDQLAAEEPAANSRFARQQLLMATVRSLIEDGLFVVGDIIGASDERVEPWPVPPEAAMARIRNEYVALYDDQNWEYRIWFALTDSGKKVAEALETKKSEG